MKRFRLITLLLFAALASACASAPPPPASAPADQIVVPVDDAAATPMPAEAASGATDASVEPTAAVEGAAPPTEAIPDEAATAAEDDFAAIYGTAEGSGETTGAGGSASAAYDPWEKVNRKIHSFNNAVDRAVARPLARAYVAVVPRPMRLGVSNFFDNLRQPLVAVNYLLQGHPARAGQALGRFVINSTLGIGGLFDPASDAQLARGSEDFGQTLGVWGWRRSRYVELPLFGPRTVRDLFGMAGEAPLGLVRQIEDDKLRFLVQGVNLVDTRAQLLAVDSLREGAADDYQLVRDAWLQRRNYQIESGRRKPDDDEGLPDYLREDSTLPTVPVDAMPMPEIGG